MGVTHVLRRGGLWCGCGFQCELRQCCQRATSDQPAGKHPLTRFIAHLHTIPEAVVDGTNIQCCVRPFRFVRQAICCSTKCMLMSPASSTSATASWVICIRIISTMKLSSPGLTARVVEKYEQLTNKKVNQLLVQHYTTVFCPNLLAGRKHNKADENFNYWLGELHRWFDYLINERASIRLKASKPIISAVDFPKFDENCHPFNEEYHADGRDDRARGYAIYPHRLVHCVEALDVSISTNFNAPKKIKGDFIGSYSS